MITNEAAMDFAIAQIDAHERGELRPDQIQELESIPGWTWDREKAVEYHQQKCDA
jgi:hypothetical protein